MNKLKSFFTPKQGSKKPARDHKTEYSFENGIFKEKYRMEYMVNYCHIYPEFDNTVWCGDESMFRVFTFRGAYMDSATKLELMSYTSRLNNVLKLLGT